MPIFGHLPALFLHFFTGVPWCANWSDPYPQITAPFPYGKGNNAKIPFLQKRFCELLINLANCHTFPSERLLSLYQSFFPRLSGKSFVIPHVMFDSINNDDYFSEHQNLELIYAGGGLSLRHPEIIVDAVEKLNIRLQGNLNLRVTFLGEAYLPLQTRIQDSACKHLFRLAGKVSYSRTLEYLSKADLALLLEAPCDEGVFLSSKLLDYLQCGKPVFAISPSVGVMADLIHKFGGGVLADCADSEDVFLKLQVIYSDWISCKLKSAKYEIVRLKQYFSENQVLTQWRTVSFYLAEKKQ